MVLVDTSIWSLSLRRVNTDLSTPEQKIIQWLQQLVREGRVQLLGPVRQEILSGIGDESQFRRIRDHLRGFVDFTLGAEDYEDAAAASNKCRRSGIASTGVDMLICAVSLRQEWPIFTADRDFSRYERVLSIRLFSPPISQLG